MLSLEFNRLLDYYRDAPQLDIVSTKKEGKKDRKGEPRNDEEKDRRVAEKGYERLYINAGKADGFFAVNLIDLLNQNTHGQRVDVGRIDLLSHYSLFDVRKGDAHRVVSALKGADFYGTRIYCEIADAEKDYAAESKRDGKKEGKKGKEKREKRSEEKPLNRRERRALKFGDSGAEKPRKNGEDFWLDDDFAPKPKRRKTEGDGKPDKPKKTASKREKKGNFDKFSKKKH